jgi:UPF0716 protein FxsA
VLALLILVIAELWVMYEVAVHIGVLETVALLVLMPIVGVWLVKRAGLAVFRRLHATLDSGGIPHKEAVDGFLLLIAGVLLIVPGFITGVAGLLLVLPPVRIAVRSLLFRSFKQRTSLAFRVVDNVGRRVDIRQVRNVRDVGSRDVTGRDVTGRDVTGRDVNDPPHPPRELES